MCGIVGFISDINAREKIIKQMNDLIIHRGPDEEGYFVNGSVGLGMKRLRIIDLISGQQPIHYKSLTIIFNGEIYNYKELKRLLEKKGYSFKTNSDTEVLLKMYAEFGDKSPAYLNGMFAFAIWDEDSQNLFLARDRFGKKPLYYFNGGDFVFASEIKSILAYPDVKKELNLKVINSYFQYRYIIGEETFFKNIYSLPPGHLMAFNKKQKNLTVKKYWELPVSSNKKDLGMEYYVKETRKKVVDSVARRMISDVPIGAYLSGGLDSSIIAAVMSNLQKSKRLSTFTIGFKEEQYNEFEYARMTSKMWNTDHHEILLDMKGYIASMEELINYKDAPLAVPNEVPLYLMSKELKKYITVVLSGEGADEAFGGYGRIFISYLGWEKTHGKGFMDFFLEKYNYTSSEALSKILRADVNQIIDRDQYTRKIFGSFFDKVTSLEIEDKIPYIFQNLHLLGLLQRLDTTTMAASVEGRCPFVDYELVEFANSIPFKYKIKWNDDLNVNIDDLPAEDISEKLDTTKFILKSAFKDMLPEKVVSRKKAGFPVPLNLWFQEGFGDYSRKILYDKKTLNRGIYDSSYLKSENLFKDNGGMTLWMMTNLELFIRKYFD